MLLRANKYTPLFKLDSALLPSFSIPWIQTWLQQQKFKHNQSSTNDEKIPIKRGIDEGTNNSEQLDKESLEGAFWRPIDTDVPEVVHGKKVQHKEYEKTMYKPGTAAKQ